MFNSGIGRRRAFAILHEAHIVRRIRVGWGLNNLDSINPTTTHETSRCCTHPCT